MPLLANSTTSCLTSARPRRRFTTTSGFSFMPQLQHTFPALQRWVGLTLTFDSLIMPDGSSVTLEAAATDLQLRPLRGKVEGKHTGKNILVRSFAGVGEVAATLVGRGSLNQPLSEGDLLRERVANNIGQASDQTVANLALTERIVVSVPADTEIYVILQKGAKETIQSSRSQSLPQAASQPNIEELRQF